MSEPTVLLTNDDGIDAPGLRALYEALSAVASVTVVAPRTNQSAVGRSLSYGRNGTEADRPNLADGVFSCHVPAVERELGYAVDGTPCDCVIAGVRGLEEPFDLVVSGCNPGANLGASVLSRSGTVSAAMEAALLGTSAVAVSVDTIGYGEAMTTDAFERATDIAADLVGDVIDADTDETPALVNLNVPRPDRPITGAAVTRPAQRYEMSAERVDGGFSIRNPLWEEIANGDVDESGVDRHAIVTGRVSVSPLTASGEYAPTESVQRFAERVDGER